jgi:hypothetical protein
MKKILILICLLVPIVSHGENTFEDEFKFLEHESERAATATITITDEVKISHAAIKKEDTPSPITDENLFFKSEELRPRRIRSR